MSLDGHRPLLGGDYTGQPRLGNAVAPHIGLETFSLAAQPELLAAPYFQEGICFLPECGRKFEKVRDWQVYCCTDCRQRGQAEMRKFGHAAALPLLIHILGKYERCDEAVMDRTRAARTHVSRVQRAWMNDRQRRALLAEVNNA